MKKITNSFIRNIVRQSLNESYGLLNEQVEPYDVTLTKAIGGIPAGTVLSGMTVPEKPDGGFSIFEIDDVETLAGDKSRQELFDLCSKYPSQMGIPLVANQTIISTTDKMMIQLNDDAIHAGTILNGLKTLSDFASFCKAYEYSKKKGANLNYAKDLNVGILRDDDETGMWHDDQGDYYNLIAQALQNSIDISKTNKKDFITQAKEKYKIVTQKATEELAASEKLKAAEAAKKAEDETNLAKIGGAGLEGFMIKHPTLVKSSKEDLSAKDGSWNARVYKLDTGDPTIDKSLYGVIVGKDGAPLAVRFREDVPTEPLTLDPDTDWRLKYGTSQSDTWEYDDVIISDDKKSIALTTDTELENPFITTESYRHKGFRHNLLTEVDLKLKDKGEEVGKIQKKLQLPPDTGTPTFGPLTLAAVIKHQTEKKLKRTDGVVDDETYASIMAIPEPAFELSAAKKSKGDDVTLVQKKLGVNVGTFGTETEDAVKKFQTDFGTKVTPPLTIDGIVNQATFDLIKNYKDPDSRKFYSGAKTDYVAKDWIIIKPNKGAEGNIFIDQEYYKIKSVSPDRMTVVLDLQMSNTDLKTPEEYSVLKVGGMTAKIVFGNESDGLTKNAPIANNNRDNNSGTRNNNNNSGTRNNNNNSGTRSNNNNSSTNIEKQKQRDVRKKEYCDTLRQIKQYINNNKGGDLTINCQYTPKTRNQIMMALTGGTIGTPVTPVTPVDQPQYNVVQPESPTNKFL